MQHGLAASHCARIFLSYNQIVTLLTKLLYHVGLDSRFNQQPASDRLLGACNGEAGRIESRLYVHAVVHQVGNELRVCERLIGSAHDAESDMCVAVLHKRRNDGVERTLAGSECIGMGGVKNK